MQWQCSSQTLTSISVEASLIFETYTPILSSLSGDILFAMFNCSAESEYTPLLRMPLASRPLNLPSISVDGLEIHDQKTSSCQRQFEGQTQSPQLGPQGNPMPLEFPAVITHHIMQRTDPESHPTGFGEP
jgi:hypothetical protein